MIRKKFLAAGVILSLSILAVVPMLWVLTRSMETIEVSINHANEFEVGFTLLNTSDRRLYYGDGYRLYRISGINRVPVELPKDSTAQSQEIDRYVDPGIPRRYHILWRRGSVTDRGFEISPGRYRFARDLFSHPEDEDPYLTMYFDFEVVNWRVSRTSNLPYSPFRQEKINLAVATGPNQGVVLGCDIVVSQTAVAFDF